ncbi:MAG: suppressor of fused domain protein [Lachnospiraceae bacterium]|nr:suppressor of fused domain protein [Lachnospiraceae bacterium]
MRDVYVLFVTKEEAEFFKQHGSDAFETYLEENEIDVAAVRR